jgi:hypothetical protein
MAVIERLTAETQARLSYLIFGGWLVLKALEGLGYIRPVADFNELLMLVGAYWFMRQRNQEKPNA